MSYSLIIPESLDRIFRKISKKDKLQFEILTRKIEEILQNPNIGKPLTANMAGMWRVHIRNFVLVYEINETTGIVKLLDYAHHDKVYR